MVDNVQKEEEMSDFVPLFVMLVNGDHVLTMGHWDENYETLCVCDPLQIVRYYNPENQDSNYVIRQWLIYSDERLMFIDREKIITCSQMNDICFGIYDKNRTDIYLTDGDVVKPPEPTKSPVEETAENCVIPKDRVLH